jgi:hypothetical protein
VGSCINERSNCAMAPKIWNTRRPPGVVVSMSGATHETSPPGETACNRRSRRPLYSSGLPRSYLCTEVAEAE